jgi:nucleotide-binding universal stress UspA family protein
MSAVIGNRCAVFDRIVCAFDGSPGSFEAARQAGVLRSSLGTIALVGVFEPAPASPAVYGAPLIVSQAEHALATQATAARSKCPGAAVELLEGATIPRLLARVNENDTTLVAVGATSRNRGIGFVRGSVATAMLHRARSSVLVARPHTAADAFPRSVTVGFDGSSAAAAALRAGREIASRFDAELRVITAGDAATAELDVLAAAIVERHEGSAVDVLLDASAESDLLVVGSRGLHGPRALGSVSERVGHRALCSVLVVRETPIT